MLNGYVELQEHIYFTRHCHNCESSDIGVFGYIDVNSPNEHSLEQ